MKLVSKISPVVAALIAAVLIVTLIVVFWPGGGTRTVVAEFPRSVSLYEGSDVKILGVAVGTVDTVTPSGTKVVVTMTYADKYKVPKDAKAAVIAPSIVGDRYVQLTPVYREGPTLEDKARLGVDRTAMPLELDQIFGSLNDLNIALGPDGANKPDASGVGPLTRLLQSTAANFGGQGQRFNDTLRDLGNLTGTLDENKDQFFSTITQLESFTNKLALNDETVRRFNDSLASGADLLEGERQDLAAALRNLSVALREVRGFIRENRDGLGRNIGKLNKLTTTLVKRRTEVDQILSWAPNALANLNLAYNERTGTLDTRANVGQTITQLETDPAAVLCTFVIQAPGGRAACDSILGALLPKPRARAGALPSGPGGTPRVVEPMDRSLGGLVEVQ